MWPFKSNPPPGGVRELLERVESLERGFKNLRLDWEDLYDRVRKAMQRIAKRAEAAEKGESRAADLGEDVPTSNTDAAPVGILQRLSERQRAIQQQILRRRLK